jgi:hypothetical protein
MTIHRDARTAGLREDVSAPRLLFDGDKAIDALWAQCLLECEGLAAACDASQHIADLIRGVFLHELANDSLNVFEGVALPARGATQNTIEIRLRGTFKRRLAAAAREYQGHFFLP